MKLHYLLYTDYSSILQTENRLLNNERQAFKQNLATIEGQQ